MWWSGRPVEVVHYVTVQTLLHSRDIVVLVGHVLEVLRVAGIGRNSRWPRNG